MNLAEIITTLNKEPNQRIPLELEAIQNSTKDIPFFKKYINAGDKQVHQKCCKYMRVEHFTQDETVFSLDSVGTKFYLILSGKVGVYIRLPKKEDEAPIVSHGHSKAAAAAKQATAPHHDPLLTCVKELNVGEAFGELALLNNKPRLASIISHNSHTVLAVLDKKDFSEILKEKEEAKLMSEMGFFAKMPFFQGWNFNLVKHLYLNVFRVKYQKGDRVFEENSPPNAVFIITSGEFDIEKTFLKDRNHEIENNPFVQQASHSHLRTTGKPAATTIRLMSYHPFELFGEEDILNGLEKRTFSAKCISVSGECIMIKQRDLFLRILKDEGAHSYLFKRLAKKNEHMNAKIASIRQSLNAFSEFRYNDYAGLKQAKDAASYMFPNQKFNESFVKNYNSTSKLGSTTEFLAPPFSPPNSTTATTTAASSITTSQSNSPLSTTLLNHRRTLSTNILNPTSNMLLSSSSSSSSRQSLCSPMTTARKIPQGIFPVSENSDTPPPRQQSLQQIRPKTTSSFQSKLALPIQENLMQSSLQSSSQAKYSVFINSASVLEADVNLSIPSPITPLDTALTPSLVVIDQHSPMTPVINGQNTLIPGINMSTSVKVSPRLILNKPLSALNTRNNNNNNSNKNTESPSPSPTQANSSNSGDPLGKQLLEKRQSRLSMLIALSTKSKQEGATAATLVSESNNQNTQNHENLIQLPEVLQQQQVNKSGSNTQAPKQERSQSEVNPMSFLEQRNKSIIITKESLLAAVSAVPRNKSTCNNVQQPNNEQQQISRSCLVTPKGVSQERKHGIVATASSTGVHIVLPSNNLHHQSRSAIPYLFQNFQQINPLKKFIQDNQIASSQSAKQIMSKQEMHKQSQQISIPELIEERQTLQTPNKNRKIASTSVYFNSAIVRPKEYELNQQHTAANSYRQSPSATTKESLNSSGLIRRQVSSRQHTWQRIDQILEKKRQIKEYANKTPVIITSTTVVAAAAAPSSAQGIIGDINQQLKRNKAEFSTIPNSISTKTLKIVPMSE